MVAKLIAEEGLSSTTGMMSSVYERIMKRMQEEIKALQQDVGDEVPEQE